jgi:multidrug transporter EmrE-like cation transporter
MAGVNVDNSGLTYLHILDGVTETLNQSSKARSKVNQNYEWRGSHLEHKLHTARNHAIGFMSDGSAFPVADKEDYVSMKVGRKIVGGSIQLTDAVMATASKSAEVALDVVSAHTQGLMKNILKFENFFFSRDGTGAVATVKAAISSTTLLVDDARGLWRGASYQVYTGSSLVGTVTISNVARAPTASGYATVTLTATLAGVTTGDKLYWNGAYGIAYTGLEALVDDSTPVGGGSTFQSVTMSGAGAEPQYTSIVQDAGGVLRALDPSLFRSLQAGIYHNVGDEPGELDCMGTGWQLANLDELYEAALRLSPDSKVGGLSTPSFQSSLGKINMSPDSDAPYNKLFLVDYSQIYRGVQKKLGWRNQSGQIFLRSDSSGVWTATAIEIAEMYIKQRNSSGKILDLEESKISMF